MAENREQNGPSNVARKFDLHDKVERMIGHWLYGIVVDIDKDDQGDWRYHMRCGRALVQTDGFGWRKRG